MVNLPCWTCRRRPRGPSWPRVHGWPGRQRQSTWSGSIQSACTYALTSSYMQFETFKTWWTAGRFWWAWCSQFSSLAHQWKAFPPGAHHVCSRNQDLFLWEKNNSWSHLVKCSRNLLPSLSSAASIARFRHFFKQSVNLKNHIEKKEVIEITLKVHLLNMVITGGSDLLKSPTSFSHLLNWESWSVLGLNTTLKNNWRTSKEKDVTPFWPR